MSVFDAARPELDPSAVLQFIINAGAGSTDAQSKREVIDAALRTAGRRGDLLFCSPDELSGAAHQAANRAVATRTAVVAVGGDGTINTVAQAAHSVGCAMGVVPQGTFNYFARTHGIPSDPVEATRLLLAWVPSPVQVATVNDQVFLVNSSLGLYPDLLEDREAYKARFGRSRGVAFLAACATLLRTRRQLRLHIEMAGMARDVQALTLFVGNNRLQLQQFGAEPQDTIAGTPGDGSMAALMLRPTGALSMLRLMLHGAMGKLGQAQSLERFEFEHMVVTPTTAPGHWGLKVAFDGEVKWMQAPFDFRVHAKPLYLLMPQRNDLPIDSVDTGV